MPRKKVSTPDEISKKIGPMQAVNYGARNIICNKMGLPHGTPIIDATEDIEIHVRASDIRKSKPRDPGACGYATALCRETGRKNIRVYRGTTLMEGTDDKGRVCIYRYINPPEMRAILQRFDSTASMLAHNVTLLAPVFSKSLKRSRAVKRIYREKVESGEHVPVPNGRQAPDPKTLRPRVLGPEPNLPRPRE